MKNSQACLLILYMISVKVHAQPIHFDHSKEYEYKTVIVNTSDTVLIMQDSVYLLSNMTFKAYNTFIDKYMDCLEKRQHDIGQIQNRFIEIQQSINEIMTLQAKKDTLTDNLLVKSYQDISAIIEELNKNAGDLSQIQRSIDKASYELDLIRKKIRKERHKQFWTRWGDWLIAGGIGLLAGGLLL
jgi:DNA repair ATPase RecN